VSTVAYLLHPKKLEDRALLLLDHCAAHPSVDIPKSKYGQIRATFLPKNTTALIQVNGSRQPFEPSNPTVMVRYLVVPQTLNCILWKF
jgi:hypothetical protein